MKYLKIYEDFNNINPNMETNRLKRVTPKQINDLKSNEVFVFGSNLQGVHTKGAGRFAIDKGWADDNQVSGLSKSGKAYAIPTQNNRKDLTLEEIKKYVDEFLEIADKNQNTTYYVTTLGIGIAGYKTEEIANLFKEAEGIINIYLPKWFWDDIIYDAY